MIEIKRIKAKETYGIRLNVLRKNIDLPYTFTGDLEKETFHLGLFLDQQLIGVVSFMKSAYKDLTGKQYQLRGMAILPEFQGKGYGKKLILSGIEILKTKGIDIVWCNARVAALNFYQKNGFQTLGKEFDIPKIGGHYVMFKDVGSVN